MKTFQIRNGFCFKDITMMAKTNDLSSFTSLVYAEAPDCVFEGWGFDPTQEGDARFIKPEPPEGWQYDDATGSFYEIGAVKPAPKQTADEILNALLLDGAKNRVQAALEMRMALQYFLQSVDVDEHPEMVLEIPSIYPAWKPGETYAEKRVISYGANAVGDPQLYQVLQEHTSAEEHKPDTATSLYKAIGVTEDGYPEWVQPLGATDAYEMGDIVSHNGVLWECTDVDGGGKNSWEPGVYGWTQKE